MNELDQLEKDAKALIEAIIWHRESPESPVRKGTIHEALGNVLGTTKKLAEAGWINETMLLAASEAGYSRP